MKNLFLVSVSQENVIKNHKLFSYFFRLRLKFSCMMELSRYPLDRQICDMQIASCKFQLKILIQGRNKVWKSGEIINMVVIICPPPPGPFQRPCDWWLILTLRSNYVHSHFIFNFLSCGFAMGGYISNANASIFIRTNSIISKAVENHRILQWFMNIFHKRQVGYIIFHSLAYLPSNCFQKLLQGGWIQI